MRETTVARRGAGRLGMILLVALVMVGGMLAAAGRPAAAHDHQIPRTVLKKGAQDLQVGRRVNESSWDQPSGNLCVNQNAIYEMRFPGVDRVAAGSKLKVRILKIQRPDSFEIAAYPKLDKEGLPVGGRVLRSTLVPVKEEGRTVAWDAVFSVNRPDRDYYLVTQGHWQDSEGCGNDQFAFWSFHVRTGG